MKQAHSAASRVFPWSIEMAKLIILSLLAALLTACSNMPLSAEFGGVNAQDPVARQSASWFEWARANNGGPN
jgi:hypothetical protein